MKQRTLSVCMIVKNGEKRLRDCLESIKKIADEIIVVDTGSTDGTIVLAKSYGAKVIETTWEDDFSKARNISLNHATKQWILILDDDEKLEEDEAKKIKELIAKKNTDQGYYLRLANIVDGVEIANSVVLRLFRNHPKHRFRNKIHEQIVNAIQEAHGENCIGKAPIRILHRGYDPEYSDIKEKSDRNLRLLLNSDEKKDGYYYYVLANEYTRLEQFEKALEIYKQSLELTDYVTYKYIHFPYLVMNMVKINCKLERYQEAIQLIHTYLPWMPDFKDLYFMLVIAYTECNKFTEAKEALRQYMNCVPTTYEYPSNSFEQSNDVEDLWRRLIIGAIKKNPILLDVYIEASKENESLETIKSICEITNKVYVVGVEMGTKEWERIKNVGAIPLEGEIKEINLLKSPVKYMMYLKAGEICSFIGEQKIADALEELEDVVLTLEVQNMMTRTIEEEIRVFKKSERYQTLSDYLEAVLNNEIEQESLGVKIYTKIG